MKKILTIGIAGLVLLFVIYQVGVWEKLQSIVLAPAESEQTVTVFSPQTQNTEQNRALQKNYAEQHVKFSRSTLLVVAAHLTGQHPDARIKILIDGKSCPAADPDRYPTLIDDFPEHAALCVLSVEKGKHHILAFNDGFKASSEEKMVLRNYILNKAELASEK